MCTAVHPSAKVIAIVLLLLDRCAGFAAVPGQAPEAFAHDCAWTLTFDDEFNGHCLDTSKWRVSDAPSLINKEQQYYTPDAVTVSQGALHIETEKREYRGRHYTSGNICSRGLFCQKYGAFVVRARFPVKRGCWCAVYLLPESGKWPPEIDITEYIGRHPHSLTLTNHAGHTPDAHHMYWASYSDPKTDFGAWHVYSIEWTPRIVRWYVDGVYKGASPPDPDSAQEPMYIQINDAIGRFGGKPDDNSLPWRFDVDYVRVYARRPLRPGRK